MRISDWSSDVCSSDLTQGVACGDRSDNRAACPDHVRILGDCRARNRHRAWRQMALALAGLRAACAGEGRDRKRVVEGKSVSVRVDTGGRRRIKTKNDKSEIELVE